MSAEFLNGKRFVLATTIEILRDDNTKEIMTGDAYNSDGEIVERTLNRDDIENGRAMFLTTRNAYDDDVGSDGPESDHEVIDDREVFSEGDVDLWLIPMEGSEPLGYRYYFDRVNGTLTYETPQGLETVEASEVGEFLYNAVRVDETGRMICRFSVPLETQEKLCKEAGALDHLADIAQDFADMKASPDGYRQGRAYTRDINQIAPDEDLTEEAIIVKQEARGETLIERSLLTERTDADWDILLNNSLFKSAQVRAIFKHFMGPRLQDFPIDQVGIARFETLEDARAVLENALPDHNEVAPFDGGAIMPGYRTSPVHEYTDGKMTVITFSDLPDMPVHAYAYPNELTMDADVTPESPAPAI